MNKRRIFPKSLKQRSQISKHVNSALHVDSCMFSDDLHMYPNHRDVNYKVCLIYMLKFDPVF